MSRWIAWLGSLKVALAGFLILGGGVLLVHPGSVQATWALALPLAFLAASLICAIVSNPLFRHQGALLAFHLALLALVILAALGRLTELRGQLELTDGEAFSGALTQAVPGPWHRYALDRVRFVNDGFDIRYEPGRKRAETRNRVRWLDEKGKEHRSVIGDSEPLVLHGYRFYTTANKGFSPVFVWQPEGGTAERGSINLPSFPIHEDRQWLEWTPPGSSLSLWTALRFDERLIDPEVETRFSLPSRHTVVVRLGESSHELSPGKSVALPGGILTYERLGTWMGYTVVHDWTLPWLAAATLSAVGALGLHFWVRFSRQPW